MVGGKGSGVVYLRAILTLVHDVSAPYGKSFLCGLSFFRRVSVAFSWNGWQKGTVLTVVRKLTTAEPGHTTA